VTQHLNGEARDALQAESDGAPEAGYDVPLGSTWRMKVLSAERRGPARKGSGDQSGGPAGTLVRPAPAADRPGAGGVNVGTDGGVGGGDGGSSRTLD
jgi:hypothetical protein